MKKKLKSKTADNVITAAFELDSIGCEIHAIIRELDRLCKRLNNINIDVKWPIEQGRLMQIRDGIEFYAGILENISNEIAPDNAPSIHKG